GALGLDRRLHGQLSHATHTCARTRGNPSLEVLGGARCGCTLPSVTRSLTPRALHFKRLGALSVLATLAACASGSLDGESESQGDQGEEGGDAREPSWPAAGPFACGSDETCTFAYVAESLDDRIEIFRLDGETPTLA